MLRRMREEERMSPATSDSRSGQRAWARPAVGLLQPKEKAEVVRELYRKHAGCLLAIEDDYRKTTLTVLGIFAAGATLLGALAKSGGASALGPLARLGLSAVIVALVLLGWFITKRRDQAHQRTRDLLVQCELALGLYEPGAYVDGETLYPLVYRNFGDDGEWMGRIYWLVVAAGVGLLVAVWGV
jgi:hypothetical protein